MVRINDEELLYRPDELKYRDEVREFVATEILPIVDRIEARDYDPRKLFKRMASSGITGLLIPEEYGGSGKPFMYQLIAGEEISAVSPTLTMMFGASCTLSAIPILEFGTEEQKEKYLVPLAKGEKIGALAITEPNVGSDTASMETKAIWDENEGSWILNGEKRFITNGSIADQIIIFAITNPDVDSKSGMSAFIIETGWEGFEVIKDYQLMGRSGVYNTHFKLTGVKVPPENMLGKENQGFLILMNELDPERVGIAAEALGCMRDPLNTDIEYSQKRVQFGRPVSRFEGVSFKISDMAMKMRASRLMMVSAARMVEKGMTCSKEAAMAKLFATEASVEICDLAIQILGGVGYVKDYYPVERFYRDARLGTIGGGSSEIMRFLIQREVYIESKREISRKKSVVEADVDFNTMMNSIPNGFRPQRAEGVTARIQFTFSDEKPWLLSIADQKCNVEQVNIDQPDMTVTTDSITWKNVMMAKTDAMKEMMAGKVTIDTADMDLLMKFARMFKFTPEMFQKE